MKTKPLPILEVREYYTNLFNELLESNQAYKYERLTECFLFILQSKTALRISDMLELKWSNIDTSSFETYLEIVLIKTKQPLTLPIDKSLFKLIQEYREYLRYEFNELNDYIFYNYKSSNGKNFSYVWSSKRIKLMNKSGVLGNTYSNIGTHSIRKGLAEHLFTKKGIRTTQYLLGHKSMKTTEIYLELDKEQHLKDLKEVL
jgi:integrase/recombinase XerC